tara:strand:+ start:103 stop:1647 length:1545 start_codon:yes stop_codon:yes gene_type:complete
MAVFQAGLPKGVAKDINNLAIPAEFYSHVNNVRFGDGAAKKISGHDSVFTAPSVAPYFLINWTTGTNSYWFYAGAAKIYRTDGSTNTDFTRASGGDYSLTATQNWVGIVYNGLVILNNGVDDPQCLANTGASAFTDLTNWPASTTCKSMRAFGNYLIALNLTESSTIYPNKIRWGDAAENFALPSSWTASATNDAGSTTVGDEGDFIVDGLQLGSVFIIYKEQSTWLMSFIGGNLVFSFKKLFSDSGVLSRNCVAEFNNQHFVVTQGDLIIHNGVSKKSVANNTVRRELFDNIDSTNYAKTFVYHNKSKSEMWVCYPQIGSTNCDKALIYNYINDSFSFRDLPGIQHIASGIVNPGASTVVWSAQSQSWIAYNTTETWGERGYNPADMSTLMAGTSNTKFFRGDYGTDFAGANFTMTLERKGLVLDKNPNTVVSVRKMTPRGSGTGSVNVYVGSSMTPNGTYTYSNPQSFNPNTQNKIDARSTGKYIAVKFEQTTNKEFELNGYDLEYDIVGER